MTLKAAGAIAAVLFVAVGMWQGFIPVPGPLLSLLAGAREAKHSARYYPPDTLERVDKLSQDPETGVSC